MPAIRFARSRAARLAACTAIAVSLGLLSTPALAGDSSPREGFLSTEFSATPIDIQADGLTSDLGDYSASEDAIAAAIIDGSVDEAPVEIVAIPEPSAFALLGCLGMLLLAMTLLRWHFDRATVPAVAANKQEAAC